MRNKKDIQIMLREAGILFAITLIAGLVLGFVYELTKEPIRIQKEKAVMEACQVVFESAEEFEPVDDLAEGPLAEELSAQGVKLGKIYKAKTADGSFAGYVIETTSTEGYGGNITIFSGITREGILNGISILSIAETPGLGMRAEEVLVPQFAEKQAEEFAVTKSIASSHREIDAISGATITSKAVTAAVNGAVRIAAALAEGGVQ